jgi:hypothetical protein
MAAAEANLGRNRLGGRVSFCHGEAGSFAGHGAELLMANVPMAVHLELLGKGAYAGRRFLILSGLLPSEADALGARILASLPLKALDSHRDERWSSWLLGMP